MTDRLYRHIISAFVVLSLMLLHSGCVEHLEEPVYEPTEYVAFKALLSGESRSVPTKGFTGCLDFEEEEWAVELDSKAETKITMYNSLNGLEAGVYGYVYTGEWDSDKAPFTYLKDIDHNGRKYKFDGDQLDAIEPIRWSEVEKNSGAKDGDTFRAFAYAPQGDVTPSYQNESEKKGAPVIKIENITECQKDILVADNKVTIKDDNSHRKETHLDFEHIFTAIQFKAGFACTITSITISNIKTSGDYVLGTGWSGSATSTLTLTLNRQLAKGETIDPILMIPQKFGEGAQISLVIDGDTSKPLTADLNGVEWRQGKKITYTLIKEREYIYLDLAAGNITIEGTSYTGAVYNNKTLETRSGTIQPGQKYYIYQSCTKNESSPNYKIGFSGDTFTPPVYKPVKGPDDRLWSDYITNNTDVTAVIKAWDNDKGAGKATDQYISSSLVNSDGAEGAVRDAGREATKNRIHITGDIGNVTMIIDNLYSSYQQRGSTPVRKRDQAGISFLPAQDGTNSELTIHIKGDNRFGCINYQNWADKTKNWLKFEGSGSLTVGDTDYYKDSSGLGSNRSCSVIGGKDEPKAEEDVYNIEFNSGVIYAGATTSSCTAIGGGGNGDTNIVINGGTITAVAKTTGTAIGGGTGLVQAGGKGNVTIKNGNVYAYNYKNNSDVPSAAIGAAGSQSAPGGESVVKIEGGYVYAYSEYGTAIGGGSSAQKHAGKGTIEISGGTIIAKTGDRNSVGIGGGSAYTDAWIPNNKATNNGGDAEITITGNPVIRTGSIGGGTPGVGADHGGKIGSAKINIKGGDIQAQFVMADSDNNTFKMTDGVIRNSNTSDNEYYCIQPNGGAVYMEKGTFTMSGGTIKQCAADATKDSKGNTVESKGGAVYLKGGKFTMSGGKIRECKANTHGGAVYLEGGSVTISGGTIEGNVAYKGNGGAICVMGGDFTMNNTNASISDNAAFGSGTTGNGGGIYVAPASSTSSSAITVNLTKGSITSNSADQYGGGICVDMGTNSVANLNVTVGADGSAGGPEITGNSTLIKGGGMYVNGAGANVMLWDGNILNNETSSYQVNPNISVIGGLVTLIKEGITTQVTVTFSNNAQYYTSGATGDETEEQYIVAASDNKLDANTFGQINDYYNEFTGWNTKRDGSGTAYTNEQIVSLNENITLYAQWK